MSKYKKFRIEKLDPISPTFCAAKWLTTDIYFHTGKTSSCEKPPPDSIDLIEVSQNILAIHNTKEKIDQRAQMLQGLQPSKCRNCWDVENKDKDADSQRFRLSSRFHNRSFNDLDLSDKIVPEIITLMFDNYCNFTCTYCDASQSSSWATDLKINGPYSKLNTDQKKIYLSLGTKNRLTEQNQQFLIDASLDMIKTNIGQIRVLRFLGGEPTINPKFWKFLSKLESVDTSKIDLEIVTNFSRLDKIKNLLKIKSRFRSFRLLISVDGTKKNSEFVRLGFEWKKFKSNIKYLLETTDINPMFLGTISSLSIDGLVNLLDWMHELNQEFPQRINYDCHVVHQPAFQKINVLPIWLKNHYKKNIIEWLDHKKDIYRDTILYSSIGSLLVMLDDELPEQEKFLLQKDLGYFLSEFSKRHNLELEDSFSSEFLKFVRTIGDHNGKTL